MATKYTLTTAFTAITETSGTIQNVGNESVELVSSTNAVEGEGIVLNPSEKRSFKGALSARSMGDAGAVVNVVDFTEAGEGGEEYDLPIASDTTLGGIKISNSFTVANDGTLSIKKSGKTILGAVKSSDDEGKVSVNNDGTMTYNPRGYRQPSTIYAIGDIKYHSALPTGWYLECTTPGISGSGDLTISSPAIGGTVTDGTVVWTVNAQQNVLHQAWGQKADFNQLTQEGFYYLGNADNAPFSDVNGRWTCIVSAARGNTGVSFGYFSQIAVQVDAPAVPLSLWIRAKTNNWLQWQQQEAIVAKSLGANGYIKYASGLILQWGSLGVLPDTATDIYFPISFSAIPTIAFGGYYCRPYTISITTSKVMVQYPSESFTGVNSGVYYVAIGY